jgi:putative FmdB family regulatory protein
MPLYEYRCEGCGRRLEVLQRMGAGAAGLTCPACGRAELTKELSRFARAAGGATGPVGPAGAGTAASCAPSAFT